MTPNLVTRPKSSKTQNSKFYRPHNPIIWVLQTTQMHMTQLIFLHFSPKFAWWVKYGQNTLAASRLSCGNETQPNKTIKKQQATTCLSIYLSFILQLDGKRFWGLLVFTLMTPCSLVPTHAAGASSKSWGRPPNPLLPPLSAIAQAQNLQCTHNHKWHRYSSLSISILNLSCVVLQIFLQFLDDSVDRLL